LYLLQLQKRSPNLDTRNEGAKGGNLQRLT
jgi:hypothetical protein